MSELNINALPDEQAICITCGFCCDGTIFFHAHLNPGERGQLPEKIEQNSYSEGENDYFLLPCHYFSEKCTIYDKKRADVCSSYRCQLLKDFAEERITIQDGLAVIKDARAMRKELMEHYRRISGNSEDLNFRQLLLELGKIMKSASEKDPVGSDYDILLARCNIFEALLIKHIRSSGDFDQMKVP